MNDYKELIEVLKNAEHIALFGNGAFNTVLVERCYEAADAIEQLVADINVVRKERDAAIAELKRLGYCSLCKHFNKAYCLNCTGDRWEWRGVTE